MSPVEAVHFETRYMQSKAIIITLVTQVCWQLPHKQREHMIKLEKPEGIKLVKSEAINQSEWDRETRPLKRQRFHQA